MRAGASRAGAYRAVIRVYVGGTLQQIDKSTLSIALTEDDRPSTASFTVPIRDATDAAIQVGQDVRIMQGDAHSTSAVLFRGRIRSIKYTGRSRSGERGSKMVEAADYRADLERKLVRVRYGATDVRSIAAALASSLTDLTQPPWSTSAVSSLGSVDDFVATNESYLTAFQRLAVRAGARWYVTGSSSPTGTALLHMYAGTEETLYGGGAAHPLTDATTHFWGLELERDLSQVRTRIYAEGAGIATLAQLPVGCRAAPTEGVPTWYTAATSAGVVSSLTQMRVNEQILDGPTYFTLDFPNGTTVATVSTAAAPYANTLVLSSAEMFTANPPNWIQINGNWIYHQNFSFPSTLHGIPSSGPGAIASSIASGAEVQQRQTLKWSTSLTRQVEAGDEFRIWMRRTSTNGSLEVITLDATDGIIESHLQDERLGIAGAFERAEALLDIYSSPEYRGVYETRDPNARPGKTIIINIQSPVSVSSVTARIADVVISDPEDSYSGYTFPVRRVTFTTQRYRDIYQILRKVEDPGD